MNERRTHALLGFLTLFDVTLVLWAGAFPGFWYLVFHGVPYDDPQGLLRRCAANWAAFALFEGLAFAKWKREPMWLAIVAGVRLSDIFTDATYVFAARDLTWFAKATLAPMSLCNLLIGLLLIRAYRARRTRVA